MRFAVAFALICALAASRLHAYNLGINLSGNAYYGNVAIYSDIMLQTSGNAYRWDVAGNGVADGPSLTDATGAPIATPLAGNVSSTQAWTGFTQYLPSGNYTLQWDGTGSISLSVGTRLALTHTTDGSGVQHNTAIYWFPGPPNQGASVQDNAWVYVSATLPVTNVHLWSPPQYRVPGSVFHAQLLEKLAPFSTMRFMDFLVTNGNRVQHWSERTLPTAGSRLGTAQGVAYEDILELGYLTGKDIWVNVPAHATDDYVCRMARLFAFGETGPVNNPDAPCNPSAPPTGPYAAHTLRPKQAVYLEYSNEIWNYGFQQVTDILCMANQGNTGGTCAFTAPTSNIAIAALNDTSLPWTSTASNKWGRGQELTFILAKRCVDIFRAAFAVAGSSAPQLRTILNVQASYYNSYYYAWSFFKTAFGSVSGTFEYFAIAPYLDVEGDEQAYSIDSIFYNLTRQLDLNTTDGNSIVTWIKNDVAYAKTLGMKVIAYEGGQGMSGTTYMSNKIGAQTDSRMYDLTRLYFEVWAALVGPDALFNYFSFAGAASQYGSWGALSSSFVHGSQKYDALLSLLLQPGDANADGSVDGTDCLAMQAAYNASSVPATDASNWKLWWMDGDFNHDGAVNAADLALLNAHVSPGLPVPICVANGNSLTAVPVPTTAPTTPAPTIAGSSASAVVPTMMLVLVATLALML